MKICQAQLAWPRSRMWGCLLRKILEVPAYRPPRVKEGWPPTSQEAGVPPFPSKTVGLSNSLSSFPECHLPSGSCQKRQLGSVYSAVFSKGKTEN